MKTGFSKDERKISSKSINIMLNKGLKLYSPSCKIFWTHSKSPVKIKLVFSVSKKKFKKAVERNYIKRIMREAYLLIKPAVYREIEGAIEVLVIYNDDRLPKLNLLKEEFLYLFNALIKKKHENTK